MSVSGQTATLNEISFIAGKKWKEIKVENEEQGWSYTWKDAIENQPVDLVYEKGKAFVLSIRTRKWILFWHQTAELKVTEQIVSEALANDGKYSFQVDKGRLGTMVLHFSTPNVGSTSNDPDRRLFSDAEKPAGQCNKDAELSCNILEHDEGRSLDNQPPRTFSYEDHLSPSLHPLSITPSDSRPLPQHAGQGYADQHSANVLKFDMVDEDISIDAKEELDSTHQRSGPKRRKDSGYGEGLGENATYGPKPASQLQHTIAEEPRNFDCFISMSNSADRELQSKQPVHESTELKRSAFDNTEHNFEVALDRRKRATTEDRMSDIAEVQVVNRHEVLGSKAATVANVEAAQSQQGHDSTRVKPSSARVANNFVDVNSEYGGVGSNEWQRAQPGYLGFPTFSRETLSSGTQKPRMPGSFVRAGSELTVNSSFPGTPPLSPSSELSSLSPYPQTPPDNVTSDSLFGNPEIATPELADTTSLENLSSVKSSGLAGLDLTDFKGEEMNGIVEYKAMPSERTLAGHQGAVLNCYQPTTREKILLSRTGPSLETASSVVDASGIMRQTDGVNGSNKTHKTLAEESATDSQDTTATNSEDGYNMLGSQESEFGLPAVIADSGRIHFPQALAMNLRKRTGRAQLSFPSMKSKHTEPAISTSEGKGRDEKDDGAGTWTRSRHNSTYRISEADARKVEDEKLGSTYLQIERRTVLITRLGLVHHYLKSILGFGVALSELDPVAKALMASVVEIIKIFESQKKVQDEMLELLDVMSRALPLLVDADKFGSIDRLKDAMILVKKIMVKTVRFAESWAKTTGFQGFLRAISDKDKNKIDGLKKDFETFISEYERGVNVEALLEIRDTKRNLQNLHLRTQLQEDTKTLDQVRDAYAHYAVMTGDADGCLVGTRENVVSQVMDWVVAANRQNVLWLRSMPGAGKSTIARTIVRRLKDGKRHGANFVFSRDDVERRTPFALWCHILYSLSCRFPAFKRAAATQLRDNRFEIGSSNAEDILNIVIQTISSLPDDEIAPDELPVIVIDALDECPRYSSLVANPRQSVLDAISKWSKLSSLFKIIVTSREDADIWKVLGDEKSAYSIYLHTGSDVDEHSSRDIRHFLRRSLSERLDPTESDLENLSHRAAGLFVWASTAVSFILGRGGWAPQRFERILKYESPGQRSDELSKLYHILLTEEFTQDPDDLIRFAFRCVIGTIVVAATPLTQSEIVDLLVGRQAPYPLEKGAIDNILERIQMLTSSRTSVSQVIRFSHQSFSEFLLHPNFRHQFYSIDSGKSESYLAARCLAMMNTELRSHMLLARPSNAYSAGEITQEHISPSLRYAVQYWATHLTKSAPMEMLNVLQVFFDEHLLQWLEIMGILGYMHRAIKMLRIVVSWLQPGNDLALPLHLVRMAQDAVHFAAYFSRCIEASAHHVHTSALAFSPTTSYVAQHYKRSSTLVLPVISRGQLSGWPDLSYLAEDESTQSLVSTSKSAEHDHVRKRQGKPTIRRSLTGQKNYVFCAAFTPDGKHVVTGSGDKTVRVWNLATGDVVKGPFTGHTARITSVAVSPDGRYLASASEDQTIRIRNLSTGKAVGNPLIGHTKFIMSIAFSHDGVLIVSGSVDKTVCIWDVVSGKLVGDPLEGHTKAVTSVAISFDGRFIASGSNDKSICIWSLKTRKLLRRLKGHTEVIFSVGFSPDGSQIVSGSGDMTVRVWRAETGETVKISDGHSKAVTSVSFSSDGKEIVSGSSDNSVRVWSTSGGMTAERVLKGHTDIVYTVACSPDGLHIVTGSRDQTMRLWNVKNHSDRVTTVAYSGDGRHIASGSRDGTVRVWNVELKDTIQHLVLDHIVGVTSLAFSADASHIVSGYADESVRVWKVDNGDMVSMRSPTVQSHRAISSVAFSSDCKSILSGTVDNRVQSWVIGPTSVQDTTIQMRDAFSASPLMALSPGGDLVAVASSDHLTLQIHSVTTGEPIGIPLKGHSDWITCFAFSADGKFIVSGSEDCTVHVWNVELGETERTLFIDQPVFSVAFSSDGKCVASGAADGQVSIWDVKMGEMICDPLEGHLQPVRSVAFSGDGKHLVSGSDDQGVRVWNLSTEDESANNVWSLSEDGWATGSRGELLFYVPPVHRPNLYRPRNTAVFGEGATAIDIGGLRHSSAGL